MSNVFIKFINHEVFLFGQKPQKVVELVLNLHNRAGNSFEISDKISLTEYRGFYKNL